MESVGVFKKKKGTKDGIGVLSTFILNSQKEKERMESLVNKVDVVAGLFEWIAIQYWFVTLPLKELGKDLTLVKKFCFSITLSSCLQCSIKWTLMQVYETIHTASFDIFLKLQICLQMINC